MRKWWIVLACASCFAQNGFPEAKVFAGERVAHRHLERGAGACGFPGVECQPLGFARWPGSRYFIG